MSEHKRGAAASIDIDALLQDTWLQVISLRHGPTFQEGEGRKLWDRCVTDMERVQRELKLSGLAAGGNGQYGYFSVPGFYPAATAGRARSDAA